MHRHGFITWLPCPSLCHFSSLPSSLSALVAAQSSDELLLGRVAEMEEQLNQQLLDGGPVEGTSQPVGAATTKAAATGGSAVDTLPPRPTFTEGLLKTTTLPRGIYRNKLNSTFLEYQRNVHKGEVELHCMGGTCPNLDSCGSAFPNVRACFWPNLVDEDYIYPDQPENCPKLSNWEEVGAKGADPRCTHPGDNLRFDKYVPQYFEIKDVFVDANGVLFNESLHFFRHGCFKDKEFAYHANQTSVQHYHRLISLLYQLGGAFYHTLIEVVPHFLLLAPLLRDNPGMPIAVSRKQASSPAWVTLNRTALLSPPAPSPPAQLKMYDSVLYPIVGISSRELNLVLVDDRDQKMLLHADMAYQVLAYVAFHARADVPYQVLADVSFHVRADVVYQLSSTASAPHPILFPPPPLQPVFQARDRAAPGVWRELRWAALPRYLPSPSSFPSSHYPLPLQPVFQACGRAAPGVWQELRGRYLVNPSIHSSFLYPPSCRTPSPPFPLQPVFQACGRAAPGVWRELRRRYLVPSDGLPMFAPGFAPRSSSSSDGTGNSSTTATNSSSIAPPWTDEQMARLPASWLAVIARRHKSKRRIAGFPQLVDSMKQIFHPSRVYVFDGKLNLTQAKTVFNRAAVFVGLHGAGLANMVFMPLNASIFEIRPRGYPNPCYHHLATATQMHYHLILGNGTKDSELKFNHTEAVEVLRLIANRTRARMSAEKFESINLLPPLEAVGEEDWEEGGGLDGDEEDNGGGGNAELTIPLELMADVTLKALNDTDVGAEEQEEEVKSLDEETIKRMESERVVTIGELSEDLKRAEMKQVHVNSGVSHDKRKAILNCTGSPCPDFSGRCESNHEASACRRDEITDEGFARPAIPINCPKKGNLTTVGPEGRDESCSHTSDFGWYEPGTFQIYLLRGVYIDHEGHVFNKTTHFNREGCNNDSPFEYKKGTKVHKLKRVVNLAYYQGRNFYHGLIEWTPQLFLLSSLLRANPTIPLLAIHDQWDFYENISKPIIGVEQFAMNRLNISRGELFYADEVYLPLYQACGKASPSLWSLLRSHFLLAPQGLPIFPPITWIQRPGLANPVNQTEAAMVPPDWMVLLVRRPGVKRSLDRWDELYESAVSVFSLNRVHVLNGSVPMLKARSLFRRARLLIAGHGAAMANMVFMRPNMTVYEIRPDKSNNACYHHLAHACGLRYYLTFGQGDGESVVKIDVWKITGVLKEIAKTFPPLPGDEHPDNVSIFGDG
ncbi:unnamed protein product [Closterium sp. Yama58-4]|nr:unnamed protein product [Closterium sp. Yama58-4]